MDSIDWLDTQGTPEAHAARDELAYLRAFNAACKEQEVVSIEPPDYHCAAMGCGLEDRNITDRYEAMYFGWEKAIDRMFEQIPDCLYENPDPEAAQLRIRVTEQSKIMASLCSQIEDLQARIATRDQQVAEACAKVLMAQQVPVGNSAAGEMACDMTLRMLRDALDEIRSGEWKKYMKSSAQFIDAMNSDEAKSYQKGVE